MFGSVFASAINIDLDVAEFALTVALKCFEVALSMDLRGLGSSLS